jgi:hypothetical protein
VVIGSHIFPLIYQNVLSDYGSRVWFTGTRRDVVYSYDFSAGFSLLVRMEALS